MRDIPNDTSIFLRIFLFALGLTVMLAVGYLVFGSTIIESYHQGGSLLFFPPDMNPEKGSLEEYAEKVSSRFWQNIVAGIPLSLLVLFGLYKLYQYLLARVTDRAEKERVIPTASVRYGILMAGAIYSSITLAYFWPSLASFSQAMIGPPEDNMACYWTLSWAHSHFFNGDRELWQIKDILYPEGSTFYFHAWSYYNLFLFHLLRQFFDGVASYNLLILHSFPLSGIGGFLLVRYFTKNGWLGLLGGFLFAFNPAHFARALHHMNIATIQFIPLFVLCFIKGIRGESRWAVVGATLFLLLAALVDWNYLLYGLWFVLLSYLYLAIRDRRIWLREVALKSALVVIGTSAILSPLLLRLVGSVLNGQSPDSGGHNMYVTDLAALVVPNRSHIIGQLSSVRQINESYSGWPWENTAYLGVVALGIVVYAYREVSRTIAPYLLGGISFLILSLGSQPHILGHLIPALVPGRIIPMLPILSISRAPARNMVFVYLFWSLIVSVAVGWLWVKITARPARVIVTTTLCLFLAFDYFATSTEVTPVRLPACYEILPQTEERYGILDLPSGYQPVERYMMYQSLHGIPIVQGWVSHRLNRSLLDRLELSDLDHQKAQLTEARVKYVILHKEYLPSAGIEPARYRIAYEEIFEDNENVVYKVY